MEENPGTRTVRGRTVVREWGRRQGHTVQGQGHGEIRVWSHTRGEERARVGDGTRVGVGGVSYPSTPTRHSGPLAFTKATHTSSETVCPTGTDRKVSTTTPFSLFYPSRPKEGSTRLTRMGFRPLSLVHEGSYSPQRYVRGVLNARHSPTLDVRWERPGVSRERVTGRRTRKGPDGTEGSWKVVTTRRGL